MSTRRASTPLPLTDDPRFRCQNDPHQENVLQRVASKKLQNLQRKNSKTEEQVVVDPLIQPTSSSMKRKLSNTSAGEPFSAHPEIFTSEGNLQESYSLNVSGLKKSNSRKGGRSASSVAFIHDDDMNLHLSHISNISTGKTLFGEGSFSLPSIPTRPAGRKKGPSTRGNAVNELAIKLMMTTKPLPSERMSPTAKKNIPAASENPRLRQILSLLQEVVKRDLDELDLSNMDLQPEDYVFIGAVLRFHPSLVSVDLRGNTLDSQRCRHLADVLQKNQFLVNVRCDDVGSGMPPKLWQAKIASILQNNKKFVKKQDKKMWIQKEKEIYNHAMKQFCKYLEEFFYTEMVLRQELTQMQATIWSELVAQSEHHKKKTLHWQRLRRIGEITAERARLVEEREVLFRRSIVEEYYTEMLVHCVNDEEGSRYVETLDYVHFMTTNKMNERRDWALAKKAEKSRMERQRKERQALEDSEGKVRLRIVYGFISGMSPLGEQEHEDWEAAQARQDLRTERERREAQAKQRAIEAARDQAEKERLQREAAIVRFKLDQRRERERMEAESYTIRKKANVDRSAFVRLVENAMTVENKYLRAYSTRQDAMKQLVSVLEQAPSMYLDAAATRHYFFGSWAPVDICPRAEFTSSVGQTWNQELQHSEPQLARAHSNLLSAFRMLQGEVRAFELYTIDSNVSEEEKVFLADLQKELNDRLQAVLKLVPPRAHGHLPVEPSRVEKEKILGGTIVIEAVPSRSFAVSPVQESLTASSSCSFGSSEFDSFFVDCPWETIPKARMVPSPPVSQPPDVIRRAVAIKKGKGGKKVSSTVPEEEGEKVLPLESVVDYDPSSELHDGCRKLQILIPENGSVTVENIIQTLRNLKYRYTDGLNSGNKVVSGGGGEAPLYVLRKFQITVTIKVASMLESTTGDGKSSAMAAVHATKTMECKSVSVSRMVICPPYIWVPRLMKFADYEEGAPQDSLVLLPGVLCHNPPTLRVMEDIVETNPHGFANGHVTIKILHADPTDYICLVTNPSICTIEKDSPIHPPSIYFNYLKNNTCVAQIREGQLIKAGTPMSPRQVVEDGQMVRLDLLAHCNALIIRRVLSRLRFATSCKGVVVGGREVSVSLVDSHGNRSSAAVFVNVMAHEDPFELILKSQRITLRRSDALSEEFARCMDRPFVYLASGATIEGPEENRFAGGWIKAEVSKPLEGDYLSILCEKCNGRLSEQPANSVTIFGRKDLVYNGVIVASIQAGHCSPSGCGLTANVKRSQSVVSKEVLQAASQGSNVYITFSEDGNCSIEAAQAIIRCFALSTEHNLSDNADRKVTITVQIGNAVKLDAEGEISKLNLEPTQWADASSVDINVGIAVPVVTFQQGITPYFEYSEGAHPFKVNFLEVREDLINGFDTFVNGFLHVEIVEGFVEGCDALLLRKNEDMNLRAKKLLNTMENNVSSPSGKDPTSTLQSTKSFKGGVTTIRLGELEADLREKLRVANVQCMTENATVKDVTMGMQGTVGTAVMKPNSIFITFGNVPGGLRRREINMMLKGLAFQSPISAHSSLQKIIRVTLKDAHQCPSSSSFAIEILRVVGVPKVHCLSTVYYRKPYSWAENFLSGIPVCPAITTQIELPEQEEASVTSSFTAGDVGGCWNGGSLSLEIDSGYVRGDRLKMMNPRQQQRLWERVEQLKAEDPKLHEEGAIPSKRIFLKIDNGEVSLIRDINSYLANEADSRSVSRCQDDSTPAVSRRNSVMLSRRNSMSISASPREKMGTPIIVTSSPETDPKEQEKQSEPTTPVPDIVQPYFLEQPPVEDEPSLLLASFSQSRVRGKPILRFDFHTSEETENFPMNINFIRVLLSYFVFDCDKQQSSEKLYSQRNLVLRLYEAMNPACAKVRLSIDVVKSPLSFLTQSGIYEPPSYTRGGNSKVYPCMAASVVAETYFGLEQGTGIINKGSLTVGLTGNQCVGDTLSFSLDKGLYSVKESSIHCGRDLIARWNLVPTRSITFHFTAQSKCKMKHLQDIFRGIGFFAPLGKSTQPESSSVSTSMHLAGLPTRYHVVSYDEDVIDEASASKTSASPQHLKIPSKPHGASKSISPSTFSLSPFSAPPAFQLFSLAPQPSGPRDTNVELFMQLEDGQFDAMFVPLSIGFSN